jgi:predicted nuclease of predicted toxin-antitoxin system
MHAYIKVQDDFLTRTRVLYIKLPITWENIENLSHEELDNFIMEQLQELVRTCDTKDIEIGGTP